MGFQLVAFDKLATAVKESIVTLLKYHGHDPSKLTESIKKLDTDRRIQSQWLLIITALLDTSREEPINKARILNAAVYYVRAQIALTYGKLPPERSNFYNSLTTSLALTKENQPGIKDEEAMYSSLVQFIRSNAYNSGNPSEGYLSENPFSNEKICGYKVGTDLIMLSTKAHELKIKIIGSAEELYIKEMKEEKKTGKKQTKPSPGLFSSSVPSTSSNTASHPTMN